jgi:hypothetical protein
MSPSILKGTSGQPVRTLVLLRRISSHITVGFPRAMDLVTKHFKNPSIPSPSSALRFSINTNPAEIMYGKKYRVEKVSTVS